MRMWFLFVQNVLHMDNSTHYIYTYLNSYDILCQQCRQKLLNFAQLLLYKPNISAIEGHPSQRPLPLAWTARRKILDLVFHRISAIWSKFLPKLILPTLVDITLTAVGNLILRENFSKRQKLESSFRLRLIMYIYFHVIQYTVYSCTLMYLSTYTITISTFYI